MKADEARTEVNSAVEEIARFRNLDVIHPGACRDCQGMHQ